MDIGEFLKLPSDIEAAGIKYAEAKAQYEYQDRMVSHLLAVLKNSIDAKTDAERTRVAEANPEFKEVFVRVRAARQAELVAKAHYEALGLKFDALRSIMSQDTAKISKGIL